MDKQKTIKWIKAAGIRAITIPQHLFSMKDKLIMMHAA